MIKRFYATQDTTITNAFRDGFLTSGSLSNMGQADSLEAFYIFAQKNTGSVERARILMQFDTDEIVSARAAGSLPASGSVTFRLKLYNAAHPFTLPKDFTMRIVPVSSSWSEGEGIDADNYLDLGEANWVYASTGSLWASEGGDFLSSPEYTASFPLGTEGIDVDVSSLVEDWVAGSVTNNGVGIMLSGTRS